MAVGITHRRALLLVTLDRGGSRLRNPAPVGRHVGIAENLWWACPAERRDASGVLSPTLGASSSGDIRAVGVADGIIGAALLRDVDVPAVVSNPNVDGARVLRKTPRERMTHATGAEGWSEAVFAAVRPVQHHVTGRM